MSFLFNYFTNFQLLGLMDLLSRALESDKSPMSRNSTEDTLGYTKETMRNTTQKSPITRKELVTGGIKIENEEQVGSSVVKGNPKIRSVRTTRNFSFFCFILIHNAASKQ